MTTVLAEVSAELGAMARGIFARNVALLPLELTLPELAWTLGRDGSLTARTNGAWLAGCSVPRRAAEVMVRQLTTRGPVACMLLPTHGQQIIATLEKLDPTWALIAIVADIETLAPMLGCCDFTQYIRAGRLFFATGEADLRQIFHDHPGLPIPQQFIRTAVTDGPASEIIIKWAQAVFGEVTQRHQQAVTTARSSWKRSNGSLCLVAPQRFRLWSDAGFALGSALEQTVIDLDDPRCCAPAFLAEKASESAAIVTVDRARADHPELANENEPWLAWITRPRVPAFVPGSPRDALLLAHESFRPLADAAGWPRERVRIAGWPAMTQTSRNANKSLALLFDVPDLTPPKEVEDFSSWRIVWDTIEKELIANPHQLANSPTAYLQKARSHFDVPETQFPAQTFIERLIAPAYAIGIARWLVREGLPLNLWGRGWDAYAELASAWRGTIDTRERFVTAVGNATAIVDPFMSESHPARSAGLPVVSTFGKTALRILQDASAALAGRGTGAAPRDVLSISVVRGLLA